MTLGPMTDEQLLALLAQKTPEELTLPELAYLKQRLADSAPLREALLGQLQMESYLTAALGRIQLSPQEIVAKARKQQASGWTGGTLLALLVCVPLLGLTAAVLVNAVRSDRSAPDETILSSRPEDAETPVENPSAAPPAVDEKAVEKNAPKASAEDPAPEQPAVSAAPATPVKPLPPPPPAKVVLPWEEVLAQQGELPAFESVAFETFDFDKRLPRQADLQPWFEAAPGSNFRLHDMDTKAGRSGGIEGVARLKSPWTEDSVLRLALEHYQKLQLHFYHGEQGVTLVHYEDQGGRWAAYATTRKDKGFKPETLAATATDDDRGRRTEIRFGGPLELRWRAGELNFSRGDIVLLSAPLAGLPEDVFFEGRTAIQGIALARTKTDPPRRRERPLAYETDRPADLPWTLQPNPARKPEDPQPTLEKLANGGLRLASDKLKQNAIVHTPLPAAGLHEIVLELDNVSPGSSVFLGRQNGQPEHVLRFLHNRRDKRTIARIMWVGDEHEGDAELYAQKPEAVVNPHCWVKLLYGCGSLRWWLSSDGVHWGQIEHATDGAKGDLTSIGLHVVANRPQTEITVRRIELRELSALSSLAAAEVRTKAASFPASPTVGDWLGNVLQRQPAGVDPAEWRRACAIRTLGAGAANELAYDLLEGLLDDGAFATKSVEEQLAVLDDAMLLAWDLRDNGGMRIGLPQRYLNVGLRAYDEQGLPPWSTVRQAAMSAPMNTWLQTPSTVEPSLRWEMIDAVQNLQPEQTLEVSRRLRFFHQRQHSPLIDWAEATAQRESLQRSRNQPIAAMKDGWRHPLIEDLSKDTYNLLNELQAVLDSEAWEDSARVITSLDPTAAIGLAPYARDRDLLVSVPVAVRLMLADYPQLRAALGDRFAALARLRLNRAMSSGDWSEVELAAVQFAGTEEAAEAHHWLGDRALASGWFERAIVEYERAGQLQPSLESQVAPRRRLSAAMLGRDAGEPVTQSVQFGELQVNATEFEALVSEMRGRGNTGISPSPTAFEAGSTGPLPPPTTYTAQIHSKVDGPVGDKPQEEVGRKTNQFRVPWPDRQLAVTVEGERMYVSNRFQVAAYNLNIGQRAWQSQPPPGAMQRAQHWALITMRPLVTSDRIFARMLYSENPLLVCLDKATGALVWSAKLSDKEFLVSDPVIVRGQLGALSIQLQESQEGVLRWNLFDAETGEVQSQRDVMRLRNTWGARACCEVVPWQDSLVAVLGGVTISFDPAGELRWQRKSTVVPADEDPRWVLQTFQRPVLAGERLFIAQPGVRAVECLEPSSGAEVWSVTLPDLVGIVGVARGQLIVRTERDLRALDLATGKIQWRHPAADLHPWQLCSDDQLIYAAKEKTPGKENEFQTRLVWLDPATGEQRGSSLLPLAVNDDPKMGPLVVFNDRLWTFFGKGQHDPIRDVAQLTPSGPAEKPADLSPAFTAWQHVPAPVVSVARRVVPDWRLLSSGPGDNIGLLPDIHGEKDVLGTRAQGGWPTVWTRPIHLPAGTKGRLRIRFGSEPGMQIKLNVSLNDQPVQELTIKDETHPDRWKNLELDLAAVAGQQGSLTITANHVGGNPAAIYWKTLEVVQ